MALKKFWAKVGKWRSGTEANNTAVAVKTAEMVTLDPARSIKKEDQLPASKAFDLLIAQLEGINENLGKHADQQHKLLERMNQLPEVLASLPKTVQSQQDLSDAICIELSRRELKEAQFLEAIESIPRQTQKQSNVLEEMNTKLSVAVDANVQVSENFNRFNNTMGKLNKTSTSQTESITQMNKTFSASDRYLKYIVSRQNTRFMWMFITSLTICMIAIISLVVVLAIIWGK
jgi:hypothetical protein